MTIPNIITIGRLIIVPFAIMMIAQQQWVSAFLLFVVAGLSDAVDGYIARRFNMRSKLGSYIDPLADKALLASIYVTLAVIGNLPVWLAITVVSRDLMILAAILVSWLMERPLEIKPLLISKLNTAAQIGFAALSLGSNAFDFDISTWETAGMIVVAVLTVASAAAYLAVWMRHVAVSSG